MGLWVEEQVREVGVGEQRAGERPGLGTPHCKYNEYAEGVVRLIRIGRESENWSWDKNAGQGRGTETGLAKDTSKDTWGDEVRLILYLGAYVVTNRSIDFPTTQGFIKGEYGRN